MTELLTSEETLDRVVVALNKIIPEFQENPLLFLYESDLQCSLFGHLRREIDYQLCLPKKVYPWH